jgi:hypothetical protein
MARLFSGTTGSTLFTWYGNNSGTALGRAVGSAGDANGDGVTDIILGGNTDQTMGLGAGMARIVSGSDGSLIRELFPDGGGDNFGQSVGNLGDLDGDGKAEQLVGAPGDQVKGTVQVFSGATGTKLHTYLGLINGSKLGHSLREMGDLDGDGFVDFVVGAPSIMFIDAGQAFVHLGGCFTVAPYCTAGTSASGCQALVSATGIASASDTSGFNVTCSSIEGDKGGLFFFGTNGQQANTWGSGTSYQCVVPPVKRSPLQLGNGTPGTCTGSYTYDFNTHWNVTKPNHNPGTGTAVQLQTWYRDPANTSNQTTSLSNAIEFALCP